MSKNKGRPKKNPPRDCAERIKALSGEGHSKRGVAIALGTSLDTFNRWLDEQPELQDAFEAGREKERFQLHNTLFQKAMKGDTVAALFLLKARHGYREGEQAEQANRVSITFNLPGALSVEEFQTKTIDAKAIDRTERLPTPGLARS